MGILTRSGCPKPEVLLAYEDNALTDDEDKVVADHLRVCERCRERMAMSVEIGVLLRRHIPLVEDPEGLEKLKRRLREPEPPPQPVQARIDFNRAVLLCVALIALFAFGIATTRTIQGGSSFTRWFSDDAPVRTTSSNEQVGGTALVAPSPVGHSIGLPYGLLPSGGSPGPAGDRYFRNANGLAISVVIERNADSQIYVDRQTGMTGIVSVDGRDVYVSSDDASIDRPVVVFHWVEGDRLVSVFILEQPPGGLRVDAVRELAAALMTRSDE